MISHSFSLGIIVVDNLHDQKQKLKRLHFQTSRAKHKKIKHQMYIIRPQYKGIKKTKSQ